MKILFKFLICTLFCFLSSAGFAQFTDSQNSILDLKNLYSNGGGELGTKGWSETGGGTLAKETSTKRSGKAAIKFTSSATGDYLNFPVVIAKKGTGNCEATIWYKSTSAVFDLEVYINSVRVALLDLPSNTEFTKATATFVCTDYVNNTQAKITNGANLDVIYVDDAYIGENQNIGSQAPLDKQYDISSYTSGDNGWSNIRATATIRKVRDNIWRVQWNIAGNTSSTTTETITVTGAVHKTVTDFYQPVSMLGATTTAARCYAAAGTSTFICGAESARTVWAISGETEVDTLPTWATDAAAETVVRAESANGFGSIFWGNLSGCFFESTAGSVMTDADCNDGIISPAGSITGTADNLQFTKNNLKANTQYKITFGGQLSTDYSGSDTQCKFNITDGTSNIASATGYASATSIAHYQQGLVGYISYPSTQSSKTFQVTALRQSGSGNCRVYCHTSVDVCTLSIEEVYPQQAAPVIVNSVGTSYAGQMKIIAGRIAGASETTACSGTCTAYRSTGDFTPTRGGTGNYTATFTTAFSESPICVCKSYRTGSQPICDAANNDSPTTGRFEILDNVGNTVDGVLDFICIGKK